MTSFREVPEAEAAGAIAAVLLTRAGTETDRLEDEPDRGGNIDNETGCEIAGGAWGDNPDTTATETDYCDLP